MSSATKRARKDSCKTLSIKKEYSYLYGRDLKTYIGTTKTWKGGILYIESAKRSSSKYGILRYESNKRFIAYSTCDKEDEKDNMKVKYSEKSDYGNDSYRPKDVEVFYMNGYLRNVKTSDTYNCVTCVKNNYYYANSFFEMLIDNDRYLSFYDDDGLKLIYAYRYLSSGIRDIYFGINTLVLNKGVYEKRNYHDAIRGHTFNLRTKKSNSLIANDINLSKVRKLILFFNALIAFSINSNDIA